MDLDGGGITVVAVLADETLESEAEKGPGVGSWAPSCCGCAPPDDGCEEDDDGGGDGRRAARSPADGFGFFALLSCVFSSQDGRLGVWLCGPAKDADGLRGLAVGRGVVWDWDWASRSRDRLTDRLLLW
jgi:hypothetical protein